MLAQLEIVVSVTRVPTLREFEAARKRGFLGDDEEFRGIAYDNSFPPGSRFNEWLHTILMPHLDAGNTMTQEQFQTINENAINPRSTFQEIGTRVGWLTLDQWAPYPVIEATVDNI